LLKALPHFGRKPVEDRRGRKSRQPGQGRKAAAATNSFRVVSGLPPLLPSSGGFMPKSAQEIYISIVEGIVRESRIKRDFINTPRFSELMGEFNRIVSGGEVVTSGSVAYELPAKYPFTKEEFEMAVDAVFKNYEPEEVSGGDRIFPRFAVNYRALGFSVTVGQGASYMVGPEVRGLTPILF